MQNKKIKEQKKKGENVGCKTKDKSKKDKTKML